MEKSTELQSIDQRLIDLETKVCHQDLIIEELHEVLYMQQKNFEVLQTKLNFYIKRAQEASATPEIRATHEKPPHY